ncbi:hypothetical protein AcW1_003264 [Taiwanofungus camphoratus]|nr:hypothetical protein AcW1_003264 [Antrodia cinnamomea]
MPQTVQGITKASAHHGQFYTSETFGTIYTRCLLTLRVQLYLMSTHSASTPPFAIARSMFGVSTSTSGYTPRPCMMKDSLSTISILSTSPHRTAHQEKSG